MYYGIFVSYPAELRYPMPPENGKGSPKECVSTKATADLHTYFLRRFAINLPSYFKKTTHQLAYMTQYFVLRPTLLRGTGRVRGLCFCVKKWGGGINYLVTHSQPASCINYRPCFTCPNNLIPGGKYDSPQTTTYPAGSTDAGGDHYSSIASSWICLLLRCQSCPPSYLYLSLLS